MTDETTKTEETHMSATTEELFETLIRKVNEELDRPGFDGQTFARKFALTRKKFLALVRSPAQSNLFRISASGKGSRKDWAASQYTGRDIQYHIRYNDMDGKRVLTYGIGFSTLWRMDNCKKEVHGKLVEITTPMEFRIRCAQRFADAYLSLKDGDLVTSLKREHGCSVSAEAHEGDDVLKKLEPDQYVTFGKSIDWEGDLPSESDFREMMDLFKGQLFDLFCAIFEEEKVQGLVGRMADLLVEHHNLVLTGAPGTGKTYLAKDMARSLMLKGGNLDFQHAFVQFHPSYDYTDFVEGLRAYESRAGQVGFVRQDGTFKQFCKKALLATLVTQCRNQLLKRLDAYAESSVKKESNESSDAQKEEFFKECVLKKCLTEDGPSSVSYTDDDVVKYLETGVCTDTRLESHFAKIAATLSDKCGLWDLAKGLEETTSAQIPKFVFVIDEINRGDLAKIFGELFFALDPGYRGPNGRIQTQYQNLVPSGDIFKGGFFVPENVYIIGTMNDIDRGVESMDFAIRRRFTWQRITPQDTQNMLDKVLLQHFEQRTINLIKQALQSLNEAIKAEEPLGEDYAIGPAYFLKLGTLPSIENGETVEPDWDALWNLFLSTLISEYLRGVPEKDEILEKLKTAYFGALPENA